MSEEISADQIEIIQDFIQESRDMMDQLEPIIIELGQSCQQGQCWELRTCPNKQCVRYGKQFEVPCWLHTGHIGDGDGSCAGAESAQDCLSCEVFRLINGDVETMNAIFRLFHSMKGSAGFLDLNNISRVAHAAESLLDLIRSGKICMDPTHVDLLCQTCDFSREALDLIETSYADTELSEPAEALTAQLKEAAEKAQARLIQPEPSVSSGPRSPSGSPEPPEARESAEHSGSSSPFKESEGSGWGLELSPEMLKRFVEEADELLQSAEQGLLKWAEEPRSQESLSCLFRDLHSFKGNCGFFGFADMERISHRMETVLEEALEGNDFSESKGPDLLLTVVDVLRAGVASISEGGEGIVENLAQHLAELDALLGKNTVPPAPAAQPDSPQTTQGPEPQPAKPPATQSLSAAPSPKPSTAAPRPTSPAPGRAQDKAAKAAPKQGVKRQDIRVDLSKLDQLINLIGELVIAENMLIHNPDIVGLELENFTKAGQQMTKLVRELQEVAMTIRMIPVSGLFRRMIRLVHDLAGKSGKKVELQLLGEETEVDKTVIEMITDPLVHLIRNALDHGLEPPEERIAAGKPEKGTVKLSARHEEGEVWITLEDDGRGLNREKILAKAISKGLIDGDGSEMSDRAVANLIFQPGFSTADKITDVSGRGVGMDVVKQNLEKIKGKIEVTYTEGAGTRLNLRIPLTLGIIDGMMVRVGDSRCIVPTLAIREAFRPNLDAITVTPDGQEMARVRENFYPVVRLHEVLGKGPGSQDLAEGILIVMEYQDTGIALFVDEICGQQQTVIKGLSDYIGNVHAASGCTILGDGEVCLILDVGHLVETAEGPRMATA